MKKILNGILTVLVFPLAILFLLGLALYTPIDYVKYKRSAYYKDRGEKYTWLCASASYLGIYEVIKKHGLPISFYKGEAEDFTGYGFFVYKDVLIVGDLLDLSVDEERKIFTTETDDEYVDIASEVEADIKEVNKLLGEDRVKTAAVLVDRDLLEENPEISYEGFELIPLVYSNYLDALRLIVGE